MTLRTALPLLALASVACTAVPVDDVGDSEDAVTTFAKEKPVWKGPTPGSTDNDLDARGVLDAWRKVKQTFYDERGLKGYDRQGNVVDLGAQYPQASEAAQCLGNAVPWWSDLLLHFYCWQPSYAVATPNVRGCFSYVTRALQGPPPVPSQPVAPGFEQRMLFYPEVYDYCLFQGYDYAKASVTGQPLPVFDTDEIDRNKRANNKIGVMRWTDENIGDAWKHIVFSWYEPKTYKLDQQEDVINAFYGVDLLGKRDYGAGDQRQVDECRRKRPLQALDPVDGTHCSSTKTFRAQQQAQNHADAKKYMLNEVVTRSYTPTTIPAIAESNLASRASSKCVDVSNVSQADGAPIHQWACNGAANQSWRFVDRGQGKFNVVSRHSGKCLDVAGNSTADGAVVQQWACAGTPNQLFSVEDTGGGFVRLVAAHSKKCIELKDGAAADGAAVLQATCATTADPKQEWKKN